MIDAIKAICVGLVLILFFIVGVVASVLLANLIFLYLPWLLPSVVLLVVAYVIGAKFLYE